LHEATALDGGALAQAFHTAATAEATAADLRLIMSVIFLAVVLAASLMLARSVIRGLGALSTGFKRFGAGDFSTTISVAGTGELADVARHANQMATSLARLIEEHDRTDWLKTGYGVLAQELRGDLASREVAERALRCLCGYLGAPAGACYGVERDGALGLLSHVALAGDA